MIILNISRRVFGSVLIDMSPLNIFPTMLLLVEYYQNCLAVLVVSSKILVHKTGNLEAIFTSSMTLYMDIMLKMSLSK